MLNYNFNAIYMFSKTSKIVFILFIFSNVLLYSQIRADQKLDPVFKSLIIPGWGQKTLGKPKRARFYNYIESGILLTLISSSTFSNIEKKNYKAFASRHAGISSSGKDHKYWVDIGNYNSINAYNDEHLRNREIDDLYSDDNKLELFATFSVGALILNHLISSIDALYLKRISSNNSLSINPYKNLILGSIGYSLTLSF